jgi:hypothetical protein
MPKLISEISSGHQFSRSSDSGLLADAQTRVFRVLLNSPGEVVDPAVACQINIGDPHPINTNIYCVSYDIKFEGESRLVFLCTFNYQSTAGGSTEEDPKSQPPDLRLATWSMSTSLTEVPLSTWKPVVNGQVGFGWVPAANPVGDLYEGLTVLSPVTTITFEQFELESPARWLSDAGYTNESTCTLAGLVCDEGTVMFRGAQGRSTVESWGGQLYRGWTVSFEFMYKFNRGIGWDIEVPQSGFNIFNAPYGSRAGAEAQNVEAGSLLLKHDGGRIKNWPNAIEPAEDTGATKTRGMVLVYEYENGGASQLPCAQPIPLNDDGAPRWSGADPKVLVKRYRVYDRTLGVFNHIRQR